MAILVASLEDFVEDEPGSSAVVYEMVSASHHSEELRAEMAELYRRWREHLADALRAKQDEGVVSLDADPEAVASIIFALGDGVGLQLFVGPLLGRLGRARARRPHRAPAARRLTTDGCKRLALFAKTSRRTTLPSRIVQTCAPSVLTSTPLPLPRPR